MNIEKILKENVLVNLNIDINEREKWDKDDSLVNGKFTIVIPLSNIDNNVSVSGIHAAFSSDDEISISKDEVKIEVFNMEFDFLNSIKDIYENVESTVKFVSNALDGLRIKDFKLLCDFYMMDYK